MGYRGIFKKYGGIDMLIKLDEVTIINLERVLVIIENKYDASLTFLFSDLTNGVEPTIVYFEDAHLRDLALTKITTDYQGDCKYCDISEYTK